MEEIKAGDQIIFPKITREQLEEIGIVKNADSFLFLCGKTVIVSEVDKEPNDWPETPQYNGGIHIVGDIDRFWLPLQWFTK